MTAMTARILQTANDKQFPIARDWFAIDDDVLYGERFFLWLFQRGRLYGSSLPSSKKYSHMCKL
jgi:hypothetical protein